MRVPAGDRAARLRRRHAGPLHHEHHAEQRRLAVRRSRRPASPGAPGRAPARRSRWPCSPGARRGRCRAGQRVAGGQGGVEAWRTAPSPPGSRRPAPAAACCSDGRVVVGLRAHDDAGLGPGRVVVGVLVVAAVPERDRPWPPPGSAATSASVAAWAANEPTQITAPTTNVVDHRAGRADEPLEPPRPAGLAGRHQAQPERDQLDQRGGDADLVRLLAAGAGHDRYATRVATSSSADHSRQRPPLPGPHGQPGERRPAAEERRPSAADRRSARAAAPGAPPRRCRAARPPTCRTDSRPRPLLGRRGSPRQRPAPGAAGPPAPASAAAARRSAPARASARSRPRTPARRSPLRPLPALVSARKGPLSTLSA